MLDKVERLKIAFVTDIHLNKNGIAKLAQWANFHYNTEPKFDYCFIGGDTANCHHDKLDHDQEEMFQLTMQTHKAIKDIFNCKLFFVPGNHDCKYFFNPNCKVEGFYNMHGKKMEISNGLDLLGFGGSTPGYVEEEQVWSGYPYSDDKQLKQEWEKHEQLSQKSKSSNQIILLTHEGPHLSETTLDRSDYPTRIVKTGSEFLSRLYERKNIVCWLHGHTHQGSINSKIAGVEVINPGALAFSKFMHFQLIKQEQRWRVNKKYFELL